MNLPYLHPADIILSRSGTFFSKAIRFFEKLKSGSANYSHSAMCLSDREVIESLWRVTVNPTSKYENEDIVIYRPKFLTMDQKRSVVNRSLKIEGQAYGVLKIPLFAMDAVFKTYLFTQTFGISHFKVCSNLIAWAYYKELGHDDIFGTGWRSVSPDVIDDYCSRWPLLWEKIYG